MNVIISDEKYDVIKKYSHYYIRFIGGQMMPIPCDLMITQEELEEIQQGKCSIEKVIRDYMNRIPWTEEEFMNRGYTDYLKNVFHMSDNEIENTMEKLKHNRALKNEMYISFMNESFPVNCWAKVDGVDAVEYSKKMGTDINQTYMWMIQKL